MKNIQENNSCSEIIGFHLPEETHGFFSNWARSEFVYAGISYSCVEQYMMAQKVALGGRSDLRDMIMHTYDPAKMKALGGKDSFTNFSDIKALWDKHCRQIVKRGVKAKFSQNPCMLEELLNTGSALLAECAAGDTIWGIGINLRDSAWMDVANWKGRNYLGQILMEVREELRREKAVFGAVQYLDFRSAAPIAEWEMTALELKRHPQFNSAIHTYADQLPAGIRDVFYSVKLADAERAIVSGRSGRLPISGFFEMKQEVYEIARRLSGKLYISDLMRIPPKQWGLRGGPYFWEDLKTHFAFDDLSMGPEELRERIRIFFEMKTGTKLTAEAMPYVKEYAHGGMSSGGVSGEWVLQTCIPLLQKRLLQAIGGA